MKIGTIILCRYSSSRLPGKILKEIEGKNYVVNTLLGFSQEWIEKPWMWIQGETITSERDYLKGVAYTVQSVFNLQTIDKGKTRIIIWYKYTFMNLEVVWSCVSNDD